jgi:hypothetical protein
MAKSRLTRINRENLTFYILDAAQPGLRVWYVSKARFQRDQMHCHIERVEAAEAEEIATLRGRRDARESKNEVLLYANSSLALTLSDTASVSIDYSEVDRVEVHEVNQSKSIAYSLLCFFGLVFL